MSDKIDIVEVSPRDGFQSVEAFIPTERKLAVLEALYASGLRRIEVTSFVSETALPQMNDAARILHAARALPGLDSQVLVPNARHAERALAAGADHLSLVVSASESHNRSNIRKTPQQTVDEFADIKSMTDASHRIRINVATAFDCPFEGTVPSDKVLEIIEGALDLWPNAEVALCDTTGRATPSHVEDVFLVARNRFTPGRGWAFHGHDTFGLGAANALSAYRAGVRVFDGSAAGLGGCPFAPGATGNTATEDLVWMFNGMNVLEGIDMDRLVGAAELIAEIEGAQLGGRVRRALRSRCREGQAA